MKSKILGLLAATLLAGPIAAQAALISNGTLAGGALVTDTATQLQWLSPVATSNQSYNTVASGSLISGQGFRFATQAEVLSLLSTNFSALPQYSAPYPSDAGTAAGYSAASQFFSVFGIAWNATCGSGPCPRTQGLTQDFPSAGRHYAVVVIQLGSNGFAFYNNVWVDTSTDSQLGSWLVRSTAPVPLPAAVWLLLPGLAGLGFVGRRRKVA